MIPFEYDYHTLKHYARLGGDHFKILQVTAHVPEPPALTLLAGGLLALGAAHVALARRAARRA